MLVQYSWQSIHFLEGLQQRIYYPITLVSQVPHSKEIFPHGWCGLVNGRQYEYKKNKSCWTCNCSEMRPVVRLSTKFMVFAYLGNGPTLTPSRAWKVHLGWDFPACRFLFRAYTGYMKVWLCLRFGDNSTPVDLLYGEVPYYYFWKCFLRQFLSRSMQGHILSLIAIYHLEFPCQIYFFVFSWRYLMCLSNMTFCKCTLMPQYDIVWNFYVISCTKALYKNHPLSSWQ